MEKQKRRPSRQWAGYSTHRTNHHFRPKSPLPPPSPPRKNKTKQKNPSLSTWNFRITTHICGISSSHWRLPPNPVCQSCKSCCVGIQSKFLLQPEKGFSRSPSCLKSFLTTATTSVTKLEELWCCYSCRCLSSQKRRWLALQENGWTAD